MIDKKYNILNEFSSYCDLCVAPDVHIEFFFKPSTSIKFFFKPAFNYLLGMFSTYIYLQYPTDQTDLSFINLKEKDIHINLCINIGFIYGELSSSIVTLMKYLCKIHIVTFDNKFNMKCDHCKSYDVQFDVNTGEVLLYIKFHIKECSLRSNIKKAREWKI